MREINVFTEIETVINGTNDKLIVVDCYAPWCGPCRALGEMFLGLTNEELDGYEIIKVNVDEADDFIMKYPVRSVPTVLYFKDGKMLDRTTGNMNKEIFLEKVNSLK